MRRAGYRNTVYTITSYIRDILKEFTYNATIFRKNIYITGATGSGKTYMAYAFGMEACKQYYTVKYVRLPDMLLELKAAREEGNIPSVLKKYTKPTLLIIDEWLLMKLSEAEARNLFELIHKRHKKSSTIN